jgi:hypothetical protein
LIEGKKCEWCGSEKNLSLHHPRRYLSHKAGYQIVAQILLSKLIRQGVYKTQRQVACPKCKSFSIYPRKTMSPKYRCIRCTNVFDKPVKLKTRWISKSDLADFHLKNKDKINVVVKAKRQESYQKYSSLEGTIVLCRACHFAAGNGRILCQVCKTHYHKPNYFMCWTCFSKTKRGQEVISENELLVYAHPWCDKKFEIKRQWWSTEADPHMCCIEHCEIDNHSCDIAKKNW